MSAALQALATEVAVRALERRDRPRLALALARAPDPALVQETLKGIDPVTLFALQPPGVGVWGMAGWMRNVWTSPRIRQLVRGANKTGKTTALSYSIASYFKGIHPTWKLPKDRPARVLYVAADLQNAYADDVCISLREFLPDSELDPSCRYDSVRGFTVSSRRQIVHRDGHRILFRSGMQDGQAIAGVWADVIIVNEPPLQQRWGEISRAASLVEGAPIVVGFTPVDNHGKNRSPVWFREEVLRDGKNWQEWVVPLSPENAPHRSPEQIQQQIDDMLSWEIPQRRDAAWEGPAPERSFSAFGPENTFLAARGDWSCLPEGPADVSKLRLKLAADHGERANKEVVILYATHTEHRIDRGRRTDVVRNWVLDCYASPGETSIAQDAEGVVQMLDGWGLTLDEIAEARGDTNSSGKGDWTARTVNEGFTNAFADLGSSLVMRPASKGAGSVSLGIRLINEACAQGRFWVASTAPRVRRALDRWDGKNDNLKDFVDPVRYGPGDELRQVRKEKRTKASPAAPPVPTPWFTGTDWDQSF